MSELASWLLEQIAADERTIHAAGPVRVGWATWRQPDGSMRYTSPVAESTDDTWVTGGHRFTVKEPVLVVFDPVERRAELAAKRELFDEIFGYEAKVDGEWGCCHSPEQIRMGQCLKTNPDEIPALRIMASAYAQRAGYQAGWAP